MVTVNVVVLAGTVAAEPVQRRMPSGDEVTEIRLSVPEAGKRLLPLPVAVWHASTGKRASFQVKEGDKVLFTSYAGNEVTADGEEYLIMSEDDILAVVE